MSEFGHIAASGGSTFIDAWGTGPFLIEAGGKTYRFEDSDRFGPYLVARNDRVLERQPGPRSPFWKAHLAWRRQGRKLADDRITCIYEPLKPTKVKHLGGRNYWIIEHGDEGGGTVVVKE